MAGFVAGGIAAAGLIGDVISAQGQQDTNAANAQQAALNRNFQAAQTQQVEQWETTMSDTAMQRRVQDLQKAGLNPLLAVQQGGASQPSVATPGGSQATMQNPAGAFTNAGQIAATAASTASQIALNNANASAADADAKLKTAQTPAPKPEVQDADGNVLVPGQTEHAIGDAQVANIQANTGLIGQNAQLAAANVNLIGRQLENVDSQTALNNIKQALTGQQYDVLAGTKQYLIQQQAALAASANNQERIMSSKMGYVIAWINAIMQPVGSAAQAAAHAAPLMME